MRVFWYSLPGLRRESGYDTVLDVGETNVVVGTTGALLLSSVELLVELRVSILNELEPSGDVGVGALSDKANGDLAGAESSPDLLVCLSQAVASEVGSESEVLVEVSDHGSRGLEVGCGEHWSRALGVEAHDGGVVEEGRYRMVRGSLCRSCLGSCIESLYPFYTSLAFVFDVVLVYAGPKWEASGRSRFRLTIQDFGGVKDFGGVTDDSSST